MFSHHSDTRTHHPQLCSLPLSIFLTPAQSNYVLASLFTIVVLIVGVYIVLNLFLAVLLGNLDQMEEDETAENKDEGGPTTPAPTIKEEAIASRNVSSR